MYLELKYDFEELYILKGQFEHNYDYQMWKCCHLRFKYNFDNESYTISAITNFVNWNQTNFLMGFF